MPGGLMLSENHPLDPFFTPRNIVLIGATEEEGSVGRAVFENLRSASFPGNIFPVNASEAIVFGVKTFPSVTDIPISADLAVIAAPRTTIPGLIRDCGTKGIRGAVVIPPGFRTGVEGQALGRQLLAEAKAAKIRIIGPDSLGIMTPSAKVNATFSRGMARPGNIGFVSQSGALCSAVLDWSFKENVGFSTFVSTGSMLDVSWGDLIDYLGQDYQTRAILIYMERIDDPSSFLSAAREVALSKPIIVIKPRRSQQDEVYDAAFRRCGVLRVTSIADLFYMAEVLSKQSRPQGPRLTILTNAGGPAAIATDTLLANGGQLAELAPETQQALDAVLPPTWSQRNPIDITSDANPDRYEKSLDIAAKDPASDGLLVVLTPQAMTDPTRVAESLTKYANINKPVLASWMGGPVVAEGEKILNDAGIPTFPYPDTAARMFQYMWRYTQSLRSLYETPALTVSKFNEAEKARSLITSARQAGKVSLESTEVQEILRIYGIQSATLPTEFPLVLSSFIDEQFGPVIKVSAGGPFREIYDDHSLGLPPLNTTLARRMLDRTRIFHQIEQHANELEILLVRFSQLLVEQQWISRSEIHLTETDRTTIHLHGNEMAEDKLPRISIRPYPVQYMSEWQARDGSAILFRPIRPEDEPLMVEFHAGVSDQSIYLRYFQFMKLSQRVDHERLIRICFNDYDREIALVAEEEGKILGVGRLKKAQETEAEFGVLIVDSAQGKGLGREMMNRLIDVAKKEGVTRLNADIHGQNSRMLGLVRKLGFRVFMEPGDPVYQATLKLS